MPRKTAFVKVSGDLCTSEDFIKKLKELCEEFFVVVCVGAGTQINNIFTKRGIGVCKHGPLGRETRSFKERQLARDTLEENQAELQDLLADRKIVATVIIPVIDVGSVLCHINGDQMVKTAYLGFDYLFVVTTPERHKQKESELLGLNKIQVLSFPSST